MTSLAIRRLLGYHYTVKHEDLNKELFNSYFIMGAGLHQKRFPKEIQIRSLLRLTFELIKNIPTATMRYNQLPELKMLSGDRISSRGL
jgi:hypothetical protein